MPKKRNESSMSFGAMLTELRKAAGFTQQELADEVGTSRRMIAYYEVQSEHPPTTLLPAIAQALGVSADALLGLAPPAKTAKAARAARPANVRLQRRLQQIETLAPTEKRQVLQLIDAFIERGQLKRKIGLRHAA